MKIPRIGRNGMENFPVLDRNESCHKQIMLYRRKGVNKHISTWINRLVCLSVCHHTIILISPFFIFCKFADKTLNDCRKTHSTKDQLGIPVLGWVFRCRSFLFSGKCFRASQLLYPTDGSQSQKEHLSMSMSNESWIYTTLWLQYCGTIKQLIKEEIYLKQT